MEEMTERVLNGFSNYGAQLLDLEETEDGISSQLLEFLSRIANCGYSNQLIYRLREVSKHLPISRLYFGGKSVEVHHPTATKYAGIVSIKEYRPSTHAGVFDGFIQMPCELIVISQSFSFVNRMVAISSMQLQQRRLVQSEDVAVSQIQEIDEALDSAMSGEFAFGMHHMTVMCIEDSPKAQGKGVLSLSVVELFKLWHHCCA